MKASFIVRGALIGAVLAFAAPASAQTWYGQLNAGASVSGSTEFGASIAGLGSASLDMDTKTGAVVSGVVGYRLMSGLALEGELLYSKNRVDDTLFQNFIGQPIDIGVRSFGGMANAVYHIDTNSPFTPYVGGGVGFGHTKVKLNGDSEDDVGVMFQVKAGVAYQVSDMFTLDFGYRYIRSPEFNFNDGGDTYTVKTGVHALMLGVRIPFGQ
jgi:OmpA-OmpF porin, OOP family